MREVSGSNLDQDTVCSLPSFSSDSPGKYGEISSVRALAHAYVSFEILRYIASASVVISTAYVTLVISEVDSCQRGPE
jgi:hypothetical protein